jgi:transcriptional regulator with XRE-family HTH domain
MSTLDHLSPGEGMQIDSVSDGREHPTRDSLHIRKAVGQAIARHRQHAGFTQEDVAERLEIGPAAVSRLERGIGSVTAERLVALAEMFGCGSEELLLVASDRPNDQEATFGQILVGLSADDRRFVIDSAERLASHLRSSTIRA